MATYREPTAAQIVSAFRAAGLDVYEMPGWAGRCRCHAGDHQKRSGPTGRRWETPRGVTWHITAGPALSGDRAIDYTHNILIGGNGHTPGPLCLAGVDADGRLLMVGAGRANHIGSISSRAASAIRSGSWPTSGYTDWRGSGVDGNAFTYGFEALSSTTPNAAQYRAMTIATAALCRLLGVDARSTHGHGEASNQRSRTDPGLDMGRVRRDVAAQLTLVPGIVKPTAPTAPTVQEDTMPEPRDLWRYEFPNVATDDPNDLVTAEVALGQAYRQSTIAVREQRVTAATLAGQIAGLTKAVEQLASAGGVDPEAIRAAVRAAVAESIDAIDVVVKGV